MENIWQEILNKPDFISSESVFLPLWTSIYILMFAAVISLAAKTPIKERNKPVFFFLMQFILNIIWSFTFFELKNIMIAFVLICFLYFFLAVTIAYAFKYSKLAAFLLLPYFLCLNILIYLNFKLLMPN